ncbi:MAG: MFS transporter [bacterium]
MDSSLIQTHKYRFFTVGAIGTFMSTLDGSILNVALPTIADQLKCNINIVAWVILAYSLTVVSLMMIFGAWTERKGYAFAYKFGYSFFITGSILCALSSSIHFLILGRVVQAIGSAMFQAVGPGMVTTVFPEKERGKGIGMMVMMVAGGMMVGPPLGGFILQYFPWQSIFIINIPIGIIGISLAFNYFKLLPKPDQFKKMNIAGALSISIAMLTGMLALSLMENYTLSDFRVVGLGVISVISMILFYRFESNPEKALIGTYLFKNHQFSTALISAILMFIAMSGAIILIPFYLERVKDFEPQTVGMFLMIFPIVMFIIAPLSGKLSDKIGSRLLTTTGMIIFAFGLYLLSFLDIDTTNRYIIITIIIISSGTAIFNSPNSSAMMGSVDKSKRSVISGIIATSRNIGMALGVAFATSLFAYFQTHIVGANDDTPLNFIKAYQPVVKISVVIALIAVPFCIIRQK